MTHFVDLLYPRKVCRFVKSNRVGSVLTLNLQSNNNEPMPATDFASILRNSLLRQMTHKATCQTCKQFATFSSRRSIATKDLPLVLAINASAYNDENQTFWLNHRNQPFLRPQVEIQGQVEGSDDPEVAVYTLRVRFCFMIQG